jgi:hypothetical protein
MNEFEKKFIQSGGFVISVDIYNCKINDRISMLVNSIDFKSVLSLQWGFQNSNPYPL